jgi:hypothetical protein
MPFTRGLDFLLDFPLALGLLLPLMLLPLMYPPPPMLVVFTPAPVAVPTAFFFAPPDSH